jgi:hypothetical protein
MPNLTTDEAYELYIRRASLEEKINRYYHDNAFARWWNERFKRMEKTNRLGSMDDFNLLWEHGQLPCKN